MNVFSFSLANVRRGYCPFNLVTESEQITTRGLNREYCD
jgi:hypothetical protein